MVLSTDVCVSLQIVGFTHMRIADGVSTQLQLMGMLAKFCTAATKSKWFKRRHAAPAAAK